ncbi:MAG: hypothetical protein E7609_03385 [Ruminococcaceae bacterium]|nr:hypothetical protein [Oscillospiraceae bacterium]
MKKRVLSLLLLLAMLVTMVPTMAVGAAAETGDGDVPRSETSATKPISDYYSLYKTDGLIAFFDAFDPTNGTVDLVNGKWYARVYNAETKQFEKSETIYAEIKGGAYDADTNATGWQSYASGIGYADPDFTATANQISFNTQTLLQYNDGAVNQRYANWAVETVVRVDLRDAAEKGGLVDDAFLFGPVKATHWSNLQHEDENDGKGAVLWTLKSTTKGVADINVTGTSSASSFVNYNGKVTPLIVRKEFVKKTVSGEESKYTVTHGDIVSTSASNAMKADFGDSGLHILKNDQGVVYALRMYASDSVKDVLSAADAAANSIVDTLLRLDVDLDVFNAMTAYKGLVERFFTETAPALGADATKEDYENAIQKLVEEEKLLESARDLNDYEKMYVGANGETTANGGKLVALFGSTELIDTEAEDWDGTWVNKLGLNHAKFNNSSVWEKRADGSIGFTGLYGQWVDGKLVNSTYDKKLPTDNILSHIYNSYAEENGKKLGGLNDPSFANTRLQLGLALLPKEDFTIEYVAKYNPIYVATPDGEIAKDDAGNPIEYYVANGNNGISAAEYTRPFDYIGFISSTSPSRDGVHSNGSPVRGDVTWKLSDKDYNNTHAWSDKKLGNNSTWASGIREYGKVNTYVFTRDETLTVGENDARTVTAVYGMLRGATPYYTSPILSTANGVNGTHYYDKDDTGNFYLSSSLPTDFYALRIYTAVLTAREMEHNAFVDMAAYVKADLSKYNALDDETKVLIENAIVPLGFSSNAEEFNASFQGIVDLYANQKTAEDALYVTDGLRVLTTAYTGFDTGALTTGSGGFSWFNAAKTGEQVSLRGAEWVRRSSAENGGYYLIKDYSKMQTVADRQFGIYLTADMLPDYEYTVELVVNPVGLVDVNEDGSYTRHIDSTSTYGIHYENGIMIGPLRCLIFPSAHDGGGQRAGLENRWCYDYGNRCWYVSPGKRNQIGTETAWKKTGINDIITYNIDYEVDEVLGRGQYVIYSDLQKQLSLRVEADKLITNDAANNAFQFMVGMPCGVFAIRVYDRMLTEAEKIQNHAADIIYFYDLNTDLLDQVLPYFEEDPTVVYRGLSELGFNLPKEQAQEIFDARLSALWLGFAGIGIRNDRTDGLRYYFDLDEGNATAMVHAGFTIEIGAIANIGQNAAPSLDGRNYDYKIVAYDGVAGRNTGFFTDSNTFALTVQAGSANKTAMMSEINVLGFVRLVSKEGKEMIFYIEPTGDNYSPNSFFGVYNHMQKNDTVLEDTALTDHLVNATEKCYERDYIYLNAAAPAGGNGSKDAPFNSFASAFAVAKTKLPLVNVPTYVTILAADGMYELHELLSIDGSEILYEFCRLLITSENGKSTLTSTKTLDNSGFVKSDGNIWAYQFEADANGEYPFFRYLYVNGSIADIARNGANSFYIANEPRYMTAFYRWEVGPWKNALNMYNAGTLKHDTLFYAEEKVELNTQFAYYRDLYLAYYDVFDLGNEASPASYSTAENASPFYYARFKELVFTKVIVSELTAFYNSETCGESMATFKEKLSSYTSIYTEETIVEKADSIYDAAKATFDRIAGLYAEGTPQYEVAKANLAKADAKCKETKANAKQLCEEYLAVFASISSEVKESTAANITLATAAYKLVEPAYPTNTQIEDEGYVFEDLPSTGVFAEVTALHEAGELTHTSLPDAAYTGLAQELQFIYYRDAYLALDEVNALTEDKLKLDAAPATENGSEQYKALFYQFLYEKLAVAELTEATDDAANRDENGAVTTYNKAPIAVYETTYENAPAGYVTVLNEIRNAQIVASGTLENFGDYSAYLPAVKEEDAPYEGKVPFVPSMEQYKAYFVMDIVGNQSFAIEQGYAKLASTAAKIKSDATAKYQAAYNLFAEAQKTYEDLLAEGKAAEAATYNTTRKNLLTALETEYASYLAQMKLAERYLSDEYEENYTLEGSGLELAFPSEWTYNVGQVIGVDYDDKIVTADGKTHVAIYFDPAHYEGFSIHDEKHFYNRMVTLQMSHAYLDRNGEYYYNAETGTLYYYSESGVDGVKFEYPTMNNMLYFTNIKNVTLKDMAFTGLDYDVISRQGFGGGQASSDPHVNAVGETDTFPSGAPVYGKMIRGFDVVGCNFHDLPCEGISFRNRVENTTVKDSSFTDIGSGAIRFGGGSAAVAVWSKTEGTENSTITNNYFDRIAVKIYSSPAVTVQYAKDIDLSYNTIRNTSYSGYSVGWSWSAAAFMYGESVRLMHVDIHHNYIESVMQQTGDGGHIYTLGGNASKEEHTLFNWTHDNYLVFTNKTGDGQGRFHAAQYYDGSSSNWENWNTVVVARSFGASGPGGAYGNRNQTAVETMTEDRFENIDTEFTMEEYVERLRKDHNSCWAYFEQTNTSAFSYNITYRDCYLINTRSELTVGTKSGSQHFEAFRNGIDAVRFHYVRNMTYVKDPARLPIDAENIIFEAGCEWAKADPYDIADNNY